MKRFGVLVVALTVASLSQAAHAKTWVRENCNLYLPTEALWRGPDGEDFEKIRERLKENGWNVRLLGEGSLTSLAGEKAGALILREYAGDDSDVERNRAGSGEMRIYIDLVELKSDCTTQNSADCLHYDNLRVVREKGFNVKTFAGMNTHQGWVADLGKIVSTAVPAARKAQRQENRFAKKLPKCKLAQSGAPAPNRSAMEAKKANVSPSDVRPAPSTGATSGGLGEN